MQATAAAVQVNNINLVRGMIGKPGCGILQMNGQPTAQNTRETGADGDLPGFRNWDNPKHIEELARILERRDDDDPALGAANPCARDISSGGNRARCACCGSAALTRRCHCQICLACATSSRNRICLWSSRTRFSPRLAIWPTWSCRRHSGERRPARSRMSIAPFTSSHKAIDPPGDARSDFEILLDYATRMDFRDKDGARLVKWSTPQEAFEAWKACTRGRPCDYSGFSYEKLSAGSGIQWPCTADQPDGTRRLYGDHHFPTDPDICESYGHDLITGAVVTPEKYGAYNPAGRAQLKAAECQPPHELPDEKYPFMLTTGRVVHHFHTRTKTGRSNALNNAAPDAYVEMCQADAERLGIKAGQLVRLTSRRGNAEAPARIGEVLAGHLFMPFHYGYWDQPERARAANELTIYEWDPVSKQPHFKVSAVQITRVN